MKPPILLFIVPALVALGCPGPKESETTASTGSVDDTDGHSSAPPSSSANTSNGSVTVTTTPPDPTTGAGPTTVPTSDASFSTGVPDSTTSTSTTTGAEECMFELPDPGSCNKIKGAHAADEPSVVPDSSTGVVFIVEPDAGAQVECDIWEQDCPEGQKCNAWSSDGDSSWDSTKCVPVVPNADPIGAPCTVEGGGASGLDSCAKGAMCWGVDEQTGMGTCVEQCTCAPENPICSADSSCLIANEGVLALCLPVCDPLDPNGCPDGQVCVGNAGEPQLFLCVVDASDDEGQLGDPCEFVNACDPTLLCADPSLLPGCDIQSAGCCVPFCDLSAPDCPQGASCLPWFEPGQAPKCLENIGVCGVQ